MREPAPERVRKRVCIAVRVQLFERGREVQCVELLELNMLILLNLIGN